MLLLLLSLFIFLVNQSNKSDLRYFCMKTGNKFENMFKKLLHKQFFYKFEAIFNKFETIFNNFEAIFLQVRSNF